VLLDLGTEFAIGEGPTQVRRQPLDRITGDGPVFAELEVSRLSHAHSVRPMHSAAKQIVGRLTDMSSPPTCALAAGGFIMTGG
jgi:hypothetical protein